MSVTWIPDAPSYGDVTRDIATPLEKGPGKAWWTSFLLAASALTLGIVLVGYTIAVGIGQLTGATLVWKPGLNQGLVRFLDPRDGATDAEHDRHTENVIASIVSSGEAFFGPTTWRGMRCMRISVCNWQTSSNDARRAIEATRRAIDASRSA